MVLCLSIDPLHLAAPPPLRLLAALAAASAAAYAGTVIPRTIQERLVNGS